MESALNAAGYVVVQPNTPEDEYAENAYSFAPIVYREHYEDINGEPAGYYVFHWMVGL